MQSSVMNMINTCTSSTEAPPREQSSDCKYFNCWRICCFSLDIKSRLACKINNKDCDMWNSTRMNFPIFLGQRIGQELEITKNHGNLQRAYFEYCVHGLHT